MDVKGAGRQGTMLILIRRPTQAVKIGTEITVKVLEIRGKQVRIGVNAPSNMDVRREETVDKEHTPPTPGADH
jgi:carbon storage regulator